MQKDSSIQKENSLQI